MVEEVLFDESGMRASGVRPPEPWTEFGSAIVDPSNLGIDRNRSRLRRTRSSFSRTIGTTEILLNSARSNPAVPNPVIGHGLIHPSFPLLGRFEQTINLLEGLDSAAYCASFGVTPGFIFEAMAGLPAYGALLVPGDGKQVYDELSQFNNYVGFGCMLVDTPSHENRILQDENGQTVVEYALSDADKERFRIGVGDWHPHDVPGGCATVIVPSNENILGLPDFIP